MQKVKAALLQMNPLVGDPAGNAEKIFTAASSAASNGASLLVAPELALCGYPPEDWVTRPEFLDACMAEASSLAARLAAFPDLAVVAGLPALFDGTVYNCAALLRNGVIEAFYRKRHLPEYGVFDEPRVFGAGSGSLVFEVKGVRIGVIICEDGWHSEPAADLASLGAKAAVSINASPFCLGKEKERIGAVMKNIVAAGLPAVYVNACGGQDEFVFDGGSFVAARDGSIAARLPSFREGMAYVELDGDGNVTCAEGAAGRALGDDEAALEALTMATRDYIGKNRFPGAIIGLSGGIDSALVLCIAARAIGPERVRAVMMPTRFTSGISLEDAEALAKRLGVRYDVIPIGGIFENYMKTLTPYFKGRPWDATEENLQARIRGMILMALSNKTGALVLTTGNKSEGAVGYSTLYGDIAGGFAVIRDVLKTRVYSICRLINAGGEVIPERILTRAPSAELREGQKDEDSLPPYETLDRVISLYVEEGMAPRDIVRETGTDQNVVRSIVKLIHRAEYKRRQSPVGPRISRVGFGRDWRYPITGKLIN